MTSLQSSSNYPDDADNNQTVPSVAAASESSNENDLTKSRQHFTRSKNSLKTNIGNATLGENGVFPLDAVGTDEGVDEAAMVADCSLLLARIDERAYQRALIRDANQILERITFPMSFPWHHAILPVVRNIPRDIDEMPAIISVDDEGFFDLDNGPLGYGAFETGKQRRRIASGKEGIRIASRRAEDVGVVELTMLRSLNSHLPPRSPDSSPEHQRRDVPFLNSFWQHKSGDANVVLSHETAQTPLLCAGDDLNEGELSLQTFTIQQARKRRKTNEVIANTQRIFVSVKVGNTSSRSSLFAPFATSSTPLLREAICPQEVQNGKVLNAATAKKLADEIGTFDCRSTAARVSLNAKSNNRVHAGRTRLMWTYNSSSEHNKVLYASALKGEKLEPGAQKRPTDVRVGVRLNGALLTIESDVAKHRLSDPKTSSKPQGEIPYSSKVVDAALNAVCAMPKSSAAKAQCMVDTGKFLNAVRLTRGETKGENFADFPSGVKFTRPVIETIPMDDGALITTCAVPGTMHSVCVQDCLNKAARRQGLLCTVCWTSSQPQFTVEECIGCGLAAHLSCCLDRGERLTLKATRSDPASKTWKCAACSAGFCAGTNPSNLPQPWTEKRTKRVTKMPAWLDNDHVALAGSNRSSTTVHASDEPKPCACCPHTGGAISAITDCRGEKVWIHEVCRLWQQPSPLKGDSTVSEPVVCALCGTTNATPMESVDKKGSTTSQVHLGLDFTTKCAANGCRIRFHPMCALLVSKLSEEEETLLVDSNEQSSPPKARSTEDEKTGDIRLTNKYTLTMAKVSYDTYTEYTTGGFGMIKSCQNKAALVPLAFCGIHNPVRDPSLYGCYPGGNHFDESNLRIPPKRKRSTR